MEVPQVEKEGRYPGLLPCPCPPLVSGDCSGIYYHFGKEPATCCEPSSHSTNRAGVACTTNLTLQPGQESEPRKGI